MIEIFDASDYVNFSEDFLRFFVSQLFAKDCHSGVRCQKRLR